VPTITPNERQILLDCARALNCWNDQRQEYVPSRRSAGSVDENRPGDEFNRRAIGATSRDRTAGPG